MNFQALFESAPGLYLVLTPDFKIAAVSNAYLTGTMTKREEIMGRPLFEVFPDNPNDPSATGTRNLNASLQRVLKSKCRDIMPIQKYDMKRPSSEGGGFEERHWSHSNSPVLNGGGEVEFIIHCVEDVTEFVKLKKDGQEKHNITEKLRVTQRMEAMGQLAGGIAHDFNNILSVVIMNCDIMLAEKNLDKKVKGSLEQIKRTGERAANLTRQLLIFSRRQLLQPTLLNLNSIVRDMGTMLNHLITEDIQLNIKVAPDLGNSYADSGQIEQILINLVVNARDAMPNGGTISIETANAHLDQTTASGNPPVDPGEYVMLSVKDAGGGMDAKTQARIFEPFFTTKGANKGTGLGLATVYGIVQQSKGTIWVHSELRKGTTFKIFLPLVKEALQKTIVPESQPGLLGGSETILVVEDSTELKDLICEALTSNGYKVLHAENGKQALSILAEKATAIDLVITDIVMPEMSGRLLAKKMEEMGEKAKLLYLSGYTEDTLSNHDISGSHPHFLEKPFTQDSLLKKVKVVLS